MKHSKAAIALGEGKRSSRSVEMSGTLCPRPQSLGGLSFPWFSRASRLSTSLRKSRASGPRPHETSWSGNGAGTVACWTCSRASFGPLDSLEFRKATTWARLRKRPPIHSANKSRASKTCVCTERAKQGASAKRGALRCP